MNITITKTENPKTKPKKGDALGFGDIFTDHMFLMNYTEGKGWHSPRIVPYGPLSLDPAAMVFHYAQEMFEGMKAYIAKDGSVRLFRPDKNITRMNSTNERLCIPQLDVEDTLQAISAIVNYEKEWIPTDEGTSLYIRPFIIAIDAHLGVRPSHEYLFAVILSPVGAYYASGINPVKIYVEDEYVRAVKGGIGFAKAGGNYAASLKAQAKAKALGYTQVLWLDGVSRKYIDEVGTMNVFFVIDGEIITPALEGSILPGVTRDSVLTLLRSWGYKVTERKLSIDEVFEASKNGTLQEAFGTGTAAVISPIGELNESGKIITLNGGKIGEISQKLYDSITGIQYGAVEDPFGWSLKI